MNIGIDARFYGLEHAGLGRYVMELISNLTKIDQRNHYTVFLRKPYNQVLELPKNFSKVTANILHYTLEEQWLLAEIFSKANLDLLHVPHFNVPLLYRRPFVVTIHDLLWHDVRGLSVTTQNPLVYLTKYLGYLAVVSHALRKSKAIFVPSKVIFKKLVRDHRIERSKINVTYEAPSQTFLPKRRTSDILKKYRLTLPFIIYTGSAYPHKNILSAALAIKLLRERGIKLTLVVASARSVFLTRLFSDIRKQNLGNAVRFVGFVPDDDLPLLYAHALTLIQPSLSEGFGLTGLEAMACNLPVIASELTIFKEIYEDAALYVDPKSVEDIATKIETLQKNPRLQRKLIQAGKNRVKHFSFKKLAHQTLEVYENIKKR